MPADLDDARILSQRITFRHTVVLTITVCNHKISILNWQRPFIMMLDDRTRNFIKTDMLAYVNESVPGYQRAVVEVPRAPFSFFQVRLPNIRGKVTWVPDSETWKVELKNPKEDLKPGVDCFGVTLKVNPQLDQEEYSKARADAYNRAIKTWSELDGSTRQRISWPQNPDLS